MPIKFGKIEKAQFFVMQDGEYKPLGNISECDLSIEPDNPSLEEEYYAYFSQDPIEFTAKMTGNIRAWVIFIKTGNDLYLRFPKKLRRKKSWTTKRDKNCYLGLKTR